MTDLQMYWVAASTRYNQEISLRDQLRTEGIEHFVPTRQAVRRFGPHVREMECAVIPNLIFIKAGWAELFRIQRRWSNKMAYIRQKDKRILVIPDSQMTDFIRLVTEMHDKIMFMPDACTVGDRVVIKEGPLAGVEGMLAVVDGKNKFVLHIGSLCAVSVRIPKSNLIRLRG